MSKALTYPPRNFQTGLLEHWPHLESIIWQGQALKGETRRILRIPLVGYFAGAVLIPYDKFLKDAEQKRYDIELLCLRFDVSYEQGGNRLTTM